MAIGRTGNRDYGACLKNALFLGSQYIKLILSGVFLCAFTYATAGLFM